MEFAFALLLLMLAAAFAWLLLRHRHQARLLAEARADLAELDPDANLEREPQLVLTLQVVDPIALAKRESRSARVLADRLPVMVTRMVYQEVMKEVEAELEARDIEVDMRLEYR